MKVENYDLLLPIGERCHICAALKDACPVPAHIFDYLGGISLDIVYDSLLTGFKDFLLKENLVVINEGDNKHYFVKDNMLDVRISHLFKTCLAPMDSIDKYYPILQYLMRKTRNNIIHSQSILCLHATQTFSYSVDEFIYWSEKIRKIFPSKKIDFVFFSYNDAETSYHSIYSKNGITIYQIARLPINECNWNDMYYWGNMPVLRRAVKDIFKCEN